MSEYTDVAPPDIKKTKTGYICAQCGLGGPYLGDLEGHECHNQQAPLPEDVETDVNLAKRYAGEAMNGSVGYYRDMGCLLSRLTGHVERLARDIETFRMLLQEREAETTKQQQRIEELDEIRQFHIREIDRLDAALVQIPMTVSSCQYCLERDKIARKARAGE